jgi:hypothetical protein
MIPVGVQFSTILVSIVVIYVWLVWLITRGPK